MDFLRLQLPTYLLSWVGEYVPYANQLNIPNCPNSNPCIQIHFQYFIRSLFIFLLGKMRVYETRGFQRPVEWSEIILFGS